MDLTLYFRILATVSFIFWLFHIIRRLGFWFYFWQLKEYRIDRFLDGVKENKSLLFPRVSVWSLILILALSFTLSLEIAHYVFLLLSFLLYFILGLRSLYFFFNKEWNFPRFTQKIIVLFSFSGLGLLIFGIRNAIYLFNFFISPFYYFLSFFLLDIFFPLIISLFVMLFQIPTFFIKKMIIKNVRRYV